MWFPQISCLWSYFLFHKNPMLMSHISNCPSGDVLGDTELISHMTAVKKQIQTEVLGGPKGREEREVSIDKSQTGYLNEVTLVRGTE